MTKIGLEIHCQLTNLKSKLFCSCKANYREFEINENICPICMGLPGSLPRLNQEAVKKATMIAMALNCTTPDKIAFFRKNYFYPDLPKNFQITQLNIYGETSIGGTGSIIVGDKKIRITRIQLEEDPGRLIYEGSSSKNLITLVDYNRAGTPLVEIVTEPDFENPKQVRDFVNILSDLLENLEVSDPGLDGAMRSDANVSIEGGNKVEIKNIGSFHDLEKAVHFEITRQESLNSRDIQIIQETRHWDDKRKITVSSRSKEEDLDYRYFLEGDIPWIIIDPKTKENLKSNMPESISSKKERYVSKYNIPTQVATVLSSDKFYSDLFEESHTEVTAKEIANIITTDLMGLIDTREKRKESKITATHLKDLADSIQSGKISRNSAKNALYEIVKTGKNLSKVMSELDLGNVSDESELLGIIKAVIFEELKAVEEAKSNPQTINYLVGKVMQKTKGKADPKLTLDLLKKQLK
ncbi:MAG: Asp-tRNA(Asn)/Glu-tRNA(Gln) amidotransferase subunit GatB [Candidatus Nitrosopumilus sp. MTA1]|uniref:Aspartyl/glutamyl-tRNA(Asn/Gln) amidotransferase subunit B n=1 Tax=Marine Group I thaumarchaeote TaxID=2511932 RepID=A0A7K4MIQ7_9ARCH|nr:MAG: Asp-tRNA(Asn)/Glu-tRNA(Gln) amidotransferase subunit GatB [Nitrosopumilus sp. YT1]NMI82845.1 Asp-tRNA(Asn)/Glu-tRNA(Gln) amidotransferase subunit GatB [Candidatus Nitrosopumilus sp. MTA1]NWJ28843.1 Asp-tRNA(Asn)/Glu-tRNA(Gln) amidotransferase subunit GatB [Marine Group I thaumarchaeote]NWJ83787.1 Asp-tRNA(Asn)/Glu-tRNA(Gln) amidotransferase subunit GatB [Marine Group I thaumarchaeote]